MATNEVKMGYGYYLGIRGRVRDQAHISRQSSTYTQMSEIISMGGLRLLCPNCAGPSV